MPKTLTKNILYVSFLSNQLGKANTMKHTIYKNDNIKILNQLIEKNKKVDVIYIDPLYNAQNKYFKSYSDFCNDWNYYIEEVLSLSSKLLVEDGIIFIQIGDDSVCKLKLICDNVFGVSNKIAMFAVKTPNQTTGNNVLKNTDYILAYSFIMQ